jgi:hypothetical protein
MRVCAQNVYACVKGSDIHSGNARYLKLAVTTGQLCRRFASLSAITATATTATATTTAAATAHDEGPGVGVGPVLEQQSRGVRPTVQRRKVEGSPACSPNTHQSCRHTSANTAPRPVKHNQPALCPASAPPRARVTETLPLPRGGCRHWKAQRVPCRSTALGLARSASSADALAGCRYSAA